MCRKTEVATSQKQEEPPKAETPEPVEPEQPKVEKLESLPKVKTEDKEDVSRHASEVTSTLGCTNGGSISRELTTKSHNPKVLTR